MKFLTYTIIGLGNRVKCNEIRELVRNQKVDFLCIQESKKKIVDEFLIRSIWGSEKCG